MESYLRKRGYSLRRFAWFFALAGLAGILLAIVGRVLGWSNEVLSVTTVVVVSTISLAALREDPREWLRWAWEEWRANRRHSG